MSTVISSLRQLFLRYCFPECVLCYVNKTNGDFFYLFIRLKNNLDVQIFIDFSSKKHWFVLRLHSVEGLDFK